MTPRWLAVVGFPGRRPGLHGVPRFPEGSDGTAPKGIISIGHRSMAINLFHMPKPWLVRQTRANLAAMGHSARLVANEFIRRACESGQPLTPLQIMKLVYYAHAWMLALCDRPLVKEEFKAWAYGPVIPDLYHAMKRYRAEPVSTPLAVPARTSRSRRGSAGFDEQEIGMIDATYHGYGKMHGLTLMQMSHDRPWEDARRRRGRSNPISNSDIKRYFKDKHRARSINA